MSSIPQDTRTSVRDSTTPRIVYVVRRGFLSMPRSVIRQRIGSLRSRGTIRSIRLGRPLPGGTLPRIDSAGASRDATRAGAAAARRVASMPRPTAVKRVAG